MDTLQTNLLNKALQGNLGHFFLVNPPGRAKEPKKYLRKWIEKIVNAYFEKNSVAVKDLKNNEDVLIIDEELVSKKFYDISFAQAISQFLSHRATRADRKWIIIEDITRMSDIHSNKLLKIFEEPPVNATIFVLNPSLSKPMATISSRAVTIRAKISVDNEKADLTKWIEKLENKNLHQFCDYFKTRADEEKQLAKALTDNWPSNAKKELFEKENQYFKAHAEDSIYNHNSYSRLTLLREIFIAIAASR